MATGHLKKTLISCDSHLDILSFNHTTAHPMRWCLLIPNLLILLMLGMEQCCWCNAAGVKDASHLVCVLDDDGTEGELKQGLAHENTLSACDMPSVPGWHEMIRLARADMVAPLEGAETWEIHTGIRRHRWLCQERC